MTTANRRQLNIPQRAGNNMRCVVLENGDLRPVFKKLKGYAAGQEIQVRIPGRGRSLAQHSRYWARLQAISDNFPEYGAYSFWEKLTARMAACCGVSAEVLHEFVKAALDTEAENFVDMDAETAKQFFRDAEEILDGMERAIFGERLEG